MRNTTQPRRWPAARWLPAMLGALAALVTAGCATAPPPGTATGLPVTDSIPDAIVWTIDQVPSPPARGIAQQDPVTLRHMATRIMRVAPGARLPEHYHGGYDETFFVHAGQLHLLLNGNAQQVRAGNVLIIPAGTTIAGDNPGPAEAVVIVVWANTGRGGPLTTPGRAPQLRP